MRLIVQSDAENDLSAAVLHYENQSPGLGVRFLDECTAAVDRALEAPGRYRRVDGEVRRCRLIRFPYSMYFRWRDQAVQVIAFSHDRRRPGHWRARLND